MVKNIYWDIINLSYCKSGNSERAIILMNSGGNKKYFVNPARM
jgi:hypothetical protein